MNAAVTEGLPDLMTQIPQLTVTHQTGESDHARVAEAYRRTGFEQQVVPFIYDMPAALRQADLVVARAGAMTVAELTACGKPAILIPLPSAIYDHQTKNAKVMEAAGAAVLLTQSMLTGSLLVRTVAGILGDPARLRAMGKPVFLCGKSTQPRSSSANVTHSWEDIMMSTGLLERQEANGTGQRGQGSQSYPPVGGVRRAPMFRKTQQIHLVGIGGRG